MTAPIHLPEFNQTFSWAMCRNAMCENFGLHYTGELPNNNNLETEDDHYRLEMDGTMHCNRCEASFELKSNEAVRPIARYFLSLSLPFADCNNQVPDNAAACIDPYNVKLVKCANHGYNVFEHFFDHGFDKRSRSRYRRAGKEHRVSCDACRHTLWLGEPLRLTVDLRFKKRIRRILEESMTHNPPSAILKKLRQYDPPKFDEDGEEEKISRKPDAYYNHLNSIGNRLRDYHAWRNARLLDPKLNIDRDTPARVYTDVMQVSLKQFGDGPRYKYLNIIVSVLDLDGSGFILAAHPTFIPENKFIKAADVISQVEIGKPGHLDNWDCLLHPGKIDKSEIRKQMKEGIPDIHRDGFFVLSPYAEAAHFLTVQKMMSRFRKVYYYMDSARDLHPAAVCALAAPIRARKVEIALFQHEKGKDDAEQEFKSYTRDEKQELLAMAYRDMEAEFSNLVRGAGQVTSSPDEERLLRASLYKDAVIGAFSKLGGWAWLTYPPPNSQYHNPRSLWLTRMPNKTFEDDGAPLLLHASLQNVDTLMSSMRSRIRALERPSARAVPGISYESSYYLPTAVSGELWIYLLDRNYRKPDHTGQPFIPAHLAGLMTDAEADRVDLGFPEKDFRDKVLNFRLGLTQAKRMSKWQR